MGPGNVEYPGILLLMAFSRNEKSLKYTTNSCWKALQIFELQL